MALTARLKPNVAGGLIGAGVTVLVGFALLNLNLPFGKALLHASYDLPFVLRPVERPDEVVMVYLDDESHAQLNQPTTAPWDRIFHTRLLDRLTAEGARAVVFDIIFDSPATNDALFAAAIKRNSHVILAADYVPSGAEGAEGMRPVRATDALLDAQAGWGISQLDARPDFLVRRHYHGPVNAEPVIYSESWAAAKLIGAPVATGPDRRLVERWVNYYGPPGILPHVGIGRVLQPEGVAAGFFSNKVVFVGAYLNTFFSGERKDEFLNPYTTTTKSDTGRPAFMSGVEVHATQFLNLLRGDWLTRSSWIAELLGLILLGCAAGYGLVQLRPHHAILIAGTVVVALAAINYLTFTRLHFWFPWLVGLVQLAVALAWAIGFNSIQLYVQKKLLERTLAFYLSPKLVKKFASDRDIMKKFLKPGAEKQIITILFSDIASFTTISEGLDSDDLAHHMNRYFEQAVAGCIHATDGTVVKYIGDAIFAFWNAPDDQIDHKLRACHAALRFRDQEPQYMNGKLLITRIGLHTGEANVGNFGSTERVDYTALGENINLASRMEGLNKYLGTIVLATGETCAAVADRIVTRPCGRFRLKGFEKAVEVHEIIDPIERAETTRAWRDAFAEALKEFQAARFDAAGKRFRHVLDLHPDDGPATFFLHRIEELRDEPPPAGWQGEIELKEK